MVVEQLIFTIFSFAIFVYMFFKMIKNNDTSYVIVLILEAIGIALNFVEVLFGIKLNMLWLILKYVFSIILPLAIIIMEISGYSLVEMTYLTKARLFLMLGDEKRAKQTLINLVTKLPNCYQAHLLLAQVYEKEGGMRKAIDEYVQSVDLNKKDYNSYYKVAELLSNLDRKDDASEMLFNLLDKKPDLLQASLLLGNILIEKEMYKDAVNIYQDALRYNPTNYELNYDLGMVYTMLNDFQSAKMYYEKAAEFNSLLYNAKYSLAEIALLYKELEEAEKRFLEVIDDEELSADAYFELAKISLIKGDKETALKYISTAIDINPKKIVEKVRNDTTFIPIMTRVPIPFNMEIEPEEEEKKSKKMSKKEKKAKEHLEDMFEITRNLSYQDIRLLRKNTANRDSVQINFDYIKQEEQKEVDD